MKETLAAAAMGLGVTLLLCTLFAACVTLPALIVMFAWNWLAPQFSAAAPVVTFWQTWVALLLLGVVGRTIFGGRSTSKKG